MINKDLINIIQAYDSQCRNFLVTSYLNIYKLYINQLKHAEVKGNQGHSKCATIGLHAILYQMSPNLDILSQHLSS